VPVGNEKNHEKSARIAGPRMGFEPGSTQIQMKLPLFQHTCSFVIRFELYFVQGQKWFFVTQWTKSCYYFISKQNEFKKL